MKVKREEVQEADRRQEKVDSRQQKSENMTALRMREDQEREYGTGSLTAEQAVKAGRQNPTCRICVAGPVSNLSCGCGQTGLGRRWGKTDR